MRCAIFVGVLVAAIALSEARTLNTIESGLLRARMLSARQATQQKAARGPDTHAPERSVATLDAIMFAGDCIQKPSTWNDPPQEFWNTGDIMQYRDDPWFPCIFAIGAVIYYANTTDDQVRKGFEYVFLQHVDEMKCMLLEEKERELKDAIYKDLDEQELEVFLEIDEVVSCHCKTRAEEKKELDKFFDDIQNAEDNTQDESVKGPGARTTSKFQDDISRKLRSPSGIRALSQLLARRGGKHGRGKTDADDKEGNSNSEDDKKRSNSKSSCNDDTKCGYGPLLSSTLDAILFAGDCALDPELYQHEETLCNDVYEALYWYTQGTPEDRVWIELEIQKHAQQYKCEEWLYLSNDIHTTMEDDTSEIQWILLALSELWSLVEDEVEAACNEKTPEQKTPTQGQIIRELKNILTKQIRLK